jgi:hypothetical protein
MTFGVAAPYCGSIGCPINRISHPAVAIDIGDYLFLRPYNHWIVPPER